MDRVLKKKGHLNAKKPEKLCTKRDPGLFANIKKKAYFRAKMRVPPVNKLEIIFLFRILLQPLYVVLKFGALPRDGAG
jgi:hypothetical protein